MGRYDKPGFLVHNFKTKSTNEYEDPFSEESQSGYSDFVFAPGYSRELPFVFVRSREHLLMLDTTDFDTVFNVARISDNMLF